MITIVSQANGFRLLSAGEGYDARRGVWEGRQRDHVGARGIAGAGGGAREGETLYGVDVGPDDLLRIDKNTATPTRVGSVASPTVGGLAFDRESGLLYGTDTQTNNLVTIDPNDGSTTVVGNTGVALLHGLAIQPSNGGLYASDTGEEEGYVSRLYRINKASGEATLVGETGFTGISALDFDPRTGILWGAHGERTNDGFLITIDTSTGQGTLTVNTHRIQGMAFDQGGVLYATNNGCCPDPDSDGPSLYVIDTESGEWSLVGPVGSNILGIDIEIPLPSGRVFVRGDCNDDGRVNIADATCILNWLFGGGETLGCVGATNTNGDDAANITDATYLLSHLFSGGPAPVAPFPDCGPGLLPADAELGCAEPLDCQ